MAREEGFFLIISASRRTDIPAFYGEWFMGRLRRGFFRRVNPYNPNQSGICELNPGTVDVIVFFSKNPHPFLRWIPEIDERGYHFIFHFTLNDYPEWLEPGVPGIEERIGTFADLSSMIGKERLIWRYDPIVLSSSTPPDYHLERLERIAGRLKGLTQRIQISLMDFYPKMNRRLEALQRDRGIVFRDWLEEESTDALGQLCEGVRTIADQNRMTVHSCAEPARLRNFGISPGSCVDGELIRSLFKIEKDFKKDPYQRPECLCAQSVDMGMYNTCGLSCVYCYANHDLRLVEANRTRHEPQGESILDKKSH